MFIYLSEDQGTRIWALTGLGYEDSGLGNGDLRQEEWRLGCEEGFAAIGRYAVPYIDKY